GNIRLLAALTLAPGPTSIALTATSLRAPTSVAPSMLVISMNTSVAPPFPAGRAQGKLTTNIAAAMAGANASINPAIRAIILGMGVRDDMGVRTTARSRQRRQCPAGAEFSLIGMITCRHGRIGIALCANLLTGVRG